MPVDIPPRGPARAAPGVPSPRMPAATAIGAGLSALGATVADVGQAAIERAAALTAQRELASLRSETADQLRDAKEAAPIGADGFADGVLDTFDAGARARRECAGDRPRLA